MIIQVKKGFVNLSSTPALVETKFSYMTEIDTIYQMDIRLAALHSSMAIVILLRQHLKLPRNIHPQQDAYDHITCFNV